MNDSGICLETLVRQAAKRMEAAGLVFGHGTDNAFDEACWMASVALKLTPDFDPGQFSRPVAGPELSHFQQLLDARITSRKPLAYLTGEAWFAGLSFAVSDSVLIPRSPLAELIVDGFRPWLDPAGMRRALDIGTGSGCLAVALAQYWPQVTVDAVDISTDALAVAERNIRRHGLGKRVRAVHSDLFRALPGQRYDLILANPPYVPQASMATLAPEFRWEPSIALAAGDDGLDLVRRILAEAAEHLAETGILVCEVGEAAEAVDRMLAAHELTWLEFEHGGDGVFMLDRNTLDKLQSY